MGRAAPPARRGGGRRRAPTRCCCSSTRASTRPASGPNRWDRPTDGTPVIDVDRGGKITWHGPGQLVGYPILRLPDPIDVVAYVRRVEQMLIDVCAELGVATTACRATAAAASGCRADDRGPDRKVAAIGIRVARGVTLHGFALNCDCDLSAYDRIVPCGIRDAGVTSLSAELGRDVTVAEVLPVVERHLAAPCSPGRRPPVNLGMILSRPGQPRSSKIQTRAAGYGVSRCRSRGNAVTSRTLAAPSSRATNRSSPIANPPCGGMPWRKPSR